MMLVMPKRMTSHKILQLMSYLYRVLQEFPFCRSTLCMQSPFPLRTRRAAVASVPLFAYEFASDTLTGS